MDVIVIFDLGTASKRLFLFDHWLNIVHHEEQPVVSASGTEGTVGVGGELVPSWMRSSLGALIRSGDYQVRAVSTVLHGALIGSEANEPVIEGLTVKSGEILHESYASLVPYLKGSVEQFILVATGTWCTLMNPFNTGPFTAKQQHGDVMDYLSIDQKQVITSHLKLGYIHDRNVERLNDHYGVTDELYKTIKNRSKTLGRMLASKRGRVFFRHGVPPGYVDNEVNLSHFLAFADAYHQLIFDLVDVCMEPIRQILAPDDKTEIVYITGGFAGNESFVHTLAARLPYKRVFTSDLTNVSALGAAMTVYESAFGVPVPTTYLGLRWINNND